MSDVGCEGLEEEGELCVAFTDHTMFVVRFLCMDI